MSTLIFNGSIPTSLCDTYHSNSKNPHLDHASIYLWRPTPRKLYFRLLPTTVIHSFFVLSIYHTTHTHLLDHWIYISFRFWISTMYIPLPRSFTFYISSQYGASVNYRPRRSWSLRCLPLAVPSCILIRDKHYCYQFSTPGGLLRSFVFIAHSSGPCTNRVRVSTCKR